jgi:hypothetical protein
MTHRVLGVAAITLLGALAALLLPALPQPLAYHDFADHRTLFGVENFLDVASNLGFLLAGLAGLVVVALPRTAFERESERLPYALFFAGVLLTALGSAYYHLEPDNERLFWDRLPMTIAFMSLVSAQVVDRIQLRAGLALLPPLLLTGAASVVYWRATERAGHGNVLPYGILQGYSLLILLWIAWRHPSRYNRANDLYLVLAAYALAKVFEVFDTQILAFGHVVSGHTLKHVAAAVGSLVVARMLRLRALRPGADGIPLQGARAGV